MAFLLLATTLFAQDFAWDEDLGFVKISSTPEETTENTAEVPVIQAFEVPATEQFEEPVEAPAVEPVEPVVEQTFPMPAAEPEEIQFSEPAEEPVAEPDYEAVAIPAEPTTAETPDEPAATAQSEPPVPQPTEQNNEEQSVEEQAEEKHTYEALALIRYKNTDTISFRLKVSYIPKPYILGVSFAAGYTDYKLLQPFYFGAFLEPHVGIPQKQFPYEYEMNGSSLSGPLIVGGKLYMPFGICVFPFQENIEFFVEFEPGLSLNMMWNSKFGKDTITSKLYPAFYGALRTGASFKGFSFFIEGNYDAILGFGVSAGLGYSINIASTPAREYAPSLE